MSSMSWNPVELYRLRCRGNFILMVENPCNRAGESMAHVPKMAGEKISIAHSTYCCPNLFFYFSCPTSISKLWIIYVYIHIWLCRCCVWITIATKQYCKWNIFIRIRGSAECWLDILSLACQPGGDWVNMWRWTKRFTIFFSNRK